MPLGCRRAARLGLCMGLFYRTKIPNFARGFRRESQFLWGEISD